MRLTSGTGDGDEELASRRGRLGRVLGEAGKTVDRHRVHAQPHAARSECVPQLMDEDGGEEQNRQRRPHQPDRAQRQVRTVVGIVAAVREADDHREQQGEGREVDGRPTDRHHPQATAGGPVGRRRPIAWPAAGRGPEPGPEPLARSPARAVGPEPGPGWARPGRSEAAQRSMVRTPGTFDGRDRSPPGQARFPAEADRPDQGHRGASAARRPRNCRMVRLVSPPWLPGPSRRRSGTRAGSLSPSRASDFMTCPLRYRFRVIDRLPEAPSSTATRGVVVHDVLERIFELAPGRRTVGEAMALFEPAWERVSVGDPAMRRSARQRRRAGCLVRLRPRPHRVLFPAGGPVATAASGARVAPRTRIGRRPGAARHPRPARRRLPPATFGSSTTRPGDPRRLSSSVQPCSS